MGNFEKVLFWNLCLIIPAGICSIALPLYLEELGMSYAEMGLIFGIGPIIALILNYLAGSHSDSIGRKTYLSVSSLLGVAYYIILIFSFKMKHFTLGVLTGHSSDAVGQSSVLAYLSDIVPKNKVGKILGWYYGISGLVKCVGIFFTGYLILFFGYKHLFAICAILSICSFLVSLTLKEKKKSMKKSGLKLFSLRGISGNVQLLFGVELISIISCQVITAFGLPLYFKTLGASIGIIGIMMGFLWAGHFVVYTLSGKLADIISPKLIYIFAFLIIIPVNILLIFEQNYILAGILFVIQGGFFGIQNPAFHKIQFKAIGKNKGRDLAFINNSSYIGIIIGAFLCGLIVDSFGFQVIFIFRVIGFSLSALLMLISLKIFGR